MGSSLVSCWTSSLIGLSLPLESSRACEQCGAGEDFAVDSDDLFAGGEFEAVGGAVEADFADGAVACDAEAERVPDVDGRSAATAASCCRGARAAGGLVGVDELIAAAFDAGEVRVRRGDVDAIVEEGGPVVGHDFVQVRDELLAVVRDDERAGVAAFAEEDVLEVGEGLLAAGLLADERVGVEPDELAFLVVGLAARPAAPGADGCAIDGAGDGGVFSRAPVAAGLVIERSGGGGEEVAVLRLGAEAGAGREDVAHVLGHSLVDPEELALLGRGEVGLVELVGAAVFAVPGVGELVREQVGFR